MRQTFVVSLGGQTCPGLVPTMAFALRCRCRAYGDRQNGKMTIIIYFEDERFGERMIGWLRDHGYPKAEIVSKS